MGLPNTPMIFTPLDPLPAASLNDLVENIEALAAGTGLNDTSLTNAKLSTTTGELGGAWQTWTPTYTNLTVGNGTHDSKYYRSGKFCAFSQVFTLGSTSSIGTDPQFSLPLTAVSYNSALMIGPAVIQDTGTKMYQGWVWLNSTTTAKFYIGVCDSTFLYNIAPTATVPIATPTTGDILASTGIYQLA